MASGPRCGLCYHLVSLLLKIVLQIVLELKICKAGYSDMVSPYPIHLRQTFTVTCSFAHVKNSVDASVKVDFVQSLKIHKVKTPDHAGSTLFLEAEARTTGPLDRRRILHNTRKRKVTGDWRGVTNLTTPIKYRRKNSNILRLRVHVHYSQCMDIGTYECQVTYIDKTTGNNKTAKRRTYVDTFNPEPHMDVKPLTSHFAENEIVFLTCYASGSSYSELVFKSKFPGDLHFRRLKFGLGVSATESFQTSRAPLYLTTMPVEDPNFNQTDLAKLVQKEVDSGAKVNILTMSDVIEGPCPDLVYSNYAATLSFVATHDFDNAEFQCDFIRGVGGPESSSSGKSTWLVSIQPEGPKKELDRGPYNMAIAAIVLLFLYLSVVLIRDNKVKKPPPPPKPFIEDKKEEVNPPQIEITEPEGPGETQRESIPMTINSNEPSVVAGSLAGSN